MICHDVRETAESFLRDELLLETNHEILQHLDTCLSCRTEIDARRRLRGALRGAYDRAPELQPRAGFTDRLRAQMLEAPVHSRAWMPSPRWLAVAASVVVGLGLSLFGLLNRSLAPAEALARDAMGDHRNCALKVRLNRTPLPLEEAADRFDPSYRLLLEAPPNDLSTPEGTVRVVDRHACAFGGRRFGHVIMNYRGRVVSLLMTTPEEPGAARELGEALPHLIGRPKDGLSVISVDGSRHAILLVSDLGSDELTQLSRVVAVPLAERLNGRLDSVDRHTLAALEEPLPVRQLVLDRWR
jgi:hypothetical protein